MVADEPSWHRNLRRGRQAARRTHSKLRSGQRVAIADVVAAERKLRSHHGSSPGRMRNGTPAWACGCGASNYGFRWSCYKCGTHYNSAASQSATDTQASTNGARQRSKSAKRRERQARAKADAAGSTNAEVAMPEVEGEDAKTKDAAMLAEIASLNQAIGIIQKSPAQSEFISNMQAQVVELNNKRISLRPPATQLVYYQRTLQELNSQLTDKTQMLVSLAQEVKKVRSTINNTQLQINDVQARIMATGVAQGNGTAHGAATVPNPLQTIMNMAQQQGDTQMVQKMQAYMATAGHIPVPMTPSAVTGHNMPFFEDTFQERTPDIMRFNTNAGPFAMPQVRPAVVTAVPPGPPEHPILIDCEMDAFATTDPYMAHKRDAQQVGLQENEDAKDTKFIRTQQALDQQLKGLFQELNLPTV
eukprot:TRINITY_DN8178_c0_g1_i3.p2 TRINITY_DN8178_c0_g1~~TRINITY_DN8178_c0_g1_i3.p2  ORF type:complete len:417 (+),score=95.17 TRINITY_DN8178_c0_g1_i3:79-1329(+)